MVRDFVSCAVGLAVRKSKKSIGWGIIMSKCISRGLSGISFGLALCALVAITVTPSKSSALQMVEGVVAYEKIKPQPKPKVSNFSISKKGFKISSSSVADACRAYLNPVRHISSHSTAMDNRWRSSSQQEAALGLLIGVRFALESKNISTDKAKVRKTMWVQQPRAQYNSDVQAIAAYRQCKNEQALDALAKD